MCSYSLSFIEGIETGKYICKTRNHRQTRQTDLCIVYLWRQGEDRSSAAREIRVATKGKIRCGLVERAYRQQQTDGSLNNGCLCSEFALELRARSRTGFLASIFVGIPVFDSWAGQGFIPSVTGLKGVWDLGVFVGGGGVCACGVRKGGCKPEPKLTLA